MNPLLKPFSGYHDTIPFSKIELAHYKPAILEGIELGKAEIETIKTNKEIPSFENTIVPYERAGELLSAVSGIFFNQNSALTSPEMQELAQELSPILTAYSNEISMDPILFEKIKAVHAQEHTAISDESRYLLEKIYKGFVRSGANLSQEKKERLKAINTELSRLSLKFGENVLKDSNNYELWITDISDLDGLPESSIDAAKMMAEEKGRKDAWLINLDYPSYLPFMQYATNRTLRKELFMAFGSRAFKDNEFNNEDNIKAIVALRHERAQLLSFKSHADFVLAERMAKTPAQVTTLWNELLDAALPLAKEEIKEIQELANRLDGPNPIERWDFSYYAEKLKDEKFAINDELLKPYFKLENVIQGAFQTAEKLFEISFEETDKIDKYHKDVSTYEVKNKNGEHLAILYADFFPRESKRGGAWMTSYKGQNKYDNKNQRPIISIVCNFTKPTSKAPSLLTFNEVTTLFHEFGHALHGMLADGHYESLSGTSVFWDFVELPSQLMENWCYEPDCLNLFARHYETGELIPMDLVQKIKESANFLSAYQTVRQVSLGQLDMTWHNLTTIPNESVYEIEKNAGSKTKLFDDLEGICTSCAFSHIFSGGYSAGYYSYKWAEVLEADAFELFKENGVFDIKTARKFKENILMRGGAEDPMVLYKKFKGNAPNSQALLRKSGLIK